MSRNVRVNARYGAENSMITKEHGNKRQRLLQTEDKRGMFNFHPSVSAHVSGEEPFK